MAEGSAASPSAVDAMLSALGEAVQARASLAAGTRDDLTRDLYEGRERPGPSDAAPFTSPHPPTGTLDASSDIPSVDALVAHCTALGARGVHAVPLLADPVRVVRVVAPPLAIRLGRVGG